jgi:hypothetical protein
MENRYVERGSTRSKVLESLISHFIVKERGTYTIGVKRHYLTKRQMELCPDMQKPVMVGEKRSFLRILTLTSSAFITSEYPTSNGV